MLVERLTDREKPSTNVICGSSILCGVSRHFLWIVHAFFQARQKNALWSTICYASDLKRPRESTHSMLSRSVQALHLLLGAAPPPAVALNHAGVRHCCCGGGWCCCCVVAHGGRRVVGGAKADERCAVLLRHAAGGAHPEAVVRRAVLVAIASVAEAMLPQVSPAFPMSRTPPLPYLRPHNFPAISPTP